MKKAVCIVSGGMDSALAMYKAKQEGYEIIALHFDYGQKTEKKEKECFYKLVQNLNIENSLVIDLAFFAKIGGSALTDNSLNVPIDGIQEGVVPITYVPFRNGIFLSIAASLAEKEGAEAIYIGVVEEDSSGYPDCTQKYIQKQEEAINEGTKKETNITIKTPLINLKKEDIVKESKKLGVPLEFTWSCYKNQDRACGVCDSCRLRLKGFEKAGLKDPIEYI
ncbi:MAG: 7-cyano-7-deazaguanine synthase [Campylobacterota bacterium]|nr:7-cyano-7-deazaguanine synthase [Campylobacterota bacterium]